MHGLIHLELERWAQSELGTEATERALAAAGVRGRHYDPHGDLVAVLVALARESGSGPQAVLERFGEALVPTLLDAYGYLIPAQWRTLELIENTEAVIHTTLRRDDRNARPPLLRTTRRGASEVLLIYASERRMCGFAKGLVRGVAAAYGQQVAMAEEQCMLSGAPTCNLSITATH